MEDIHPLTADAIGNPTSYRGYTMSWTGRQLKYAMKSTAMSSYTYDADGLRTKKLRATERSATIITSMAGWRTKSAATKSCISSTTSWEICSISATFTARQI